MEALFDAGPLATMAGHVDVDLPDGLHLRLRVLRPDDGPALVAGFTRLSPETRFMRFFTGSWQLTAAQLEYFLDLDDGRRWAIVALDRDRPSDVPGVEWGLGVGAASYTRGAHPGEAEPAIVVVDEYHRRHVGTVLLHAIAVVAYEHGIRRFAAPVLAENRGLLSLVTELGAEVRVDPDERTVVHVVFDLMGPDVPLKDTPTYELFRQIAAGA